MSVQIAIFVQMFVRNQCRYTTLARIGLSTKFVLEKLLDLQIQFCDTGLVYGTAAMDTMVAAHTQRSITKCPCPQFDFVGEFCGHTGSLCLQNETRISKLVLLWMKSQIVTCNLIHCFDYAGLPHFLLTIGSNWKASMGKVQSLN